MSYDLIPRNKSLEEFHMSAFTFPRILEICVYLFTCIQIGPEWTCSFGHDKRMGKDYPDILQNNGFPVSALEARIMSRMTRNWLLLNAGTTAIEGLQEHVREKLEDFVPWSEKSRGFRIY